MITQEENIRNGFAVCHYDNEEYETMCTSPILTSSQAPAGQGRLFRRSTVYADIL